MSFLRTAWLLPAVAAIALLAGFGGQARPAAAHPLGNFTVNRFARIDLLSTGQAKLRYVLDMAEIPAFQERKLIDRDGDGSVSSQEADAYLETKLPALTRNLKLRVAGKDIVLQVVDRQISFPAGQGGLNTLRLVVDYEGALPAEWQSGADASFKDGNYTDRVGWREIVIGAGEGVALTATSAALEDTTAELTAYPTDTLKSAPDMKEARFHFAAGANLAAPKVLSAGGAKSAAPGKTLSGFAGLVSRERLTPAFILISMLAAMAWGAAHALGPGHGKTIVAAYLVGSRGNAKHALLLGLTVTLAHISSVVTLGFVTLFAARFISTEGLYLWLSAASGLMVLAMGAVLLFARLRAVQSKSRKHDHSHVAEAHDHAHVDEHSHGHAHDHDHDHHGHSHGPVGQGWRGLVALGISGGILPCPTALVVMLGAIALDRTVYGLALVGAFSVGLATVLMGIGLLLVYGGRLLDGMSERFGLRTAFWSRALQLAPVLSALVILIAGIIMSAKSVPAII